MNEQLCKRTAEVDRQIGASVRNARMGTGLSQSRLASQLGITFQQLQKYEKGRNRIAVGTLLLIAEALSVSVHAFFEAVTPAGEPAAPGSDMARLIAAFDRITDPEARRRVLTLALAASERNGPALVLADGAAGADTAVRAEAAAIA